MTRILQLPAIILCCCSFLTASCKKSDKDTVKITRSTKEVTIQKNQLYRLDLGPRCFECGLSISRQASHYLISEISFDTSGQTMNFFYQYKPALDYTGTDEVEIKSSSGSDGESPNNIIHYTTIKFTITN